MAPFGGIPSWVAFMAIVQLGLLIVADQCKADQFIEVEKTDTITLDKLKRMIGKDYPGLTEAETAKRVAAELARSKDKHVEKTLANKYSVYELLVLNQYEAQYLKYCSKGEIEARLKICKELQRVKQDNLFHYCSYCTQQFSDKCSEHIADIINVILDVPTQKIIEFSKELDDYITQDGDEDESDKENIKGFLESNSEAFNLGASMDETCRTIIKEFENVKYFDKKAELTYDYLSQFRMKDLALPVARCKSYVEALTEV